MMTVLIIEDEIKTAKELQRNIEQSPYEITVLATLQSIKSAVKWLKENNPPDLIFSDIQLADGLSFEIFKEVEVKSPIIFCTAYDEYAIEAFKTNSVDYLLKPIDELKLNQSLEKFHKMKMFFNDFDTNEYASGIDINSILQKLTNSHKKTFLVHFQDKIIPLKTEEVACVQYDLGNVYIITFENKRYVVNQTLDEFETTLHPNDFFRANRQFIINKKAIKTIENYFSRRLLLKLTVSISEAIIVSKTKSPQILSWIENN